MKHCRHLLILLTLALALPLGAQDIHFTQFQLSPLTVNPAFTGDFEGTFRVGGIYRDQWASVIEDQYVTPSFYIDAPLFRGFGKYDWIGLGASIYADKAGTDNLQRNGFLGSLSYHLSLDKKRNTVITLGLQIGNVQFRTSNSGLIFADDFDADLNYTAQSGADHMNIDPETSFMDINGGILLTSRLNDQMDFNVGFSMFHINTPDYSLLNSRRSDIPMRMVLHGQYNVQMTDIWSVSPAFIYQSMESNSEISLQALAGVLLDEEKEITLKFGPGYRLRDAAEIIVGFEYGNFMGGISYDINISDLDVVSNNQGGFEIALAYIAKIYKTPEPDPIIFCPRL